MATSHLNPSTPNFTQYSNTLISSSQSVLKNNKKIVNMIKFFDFFVMPTFRQNSNQLYQSISQFEQMVCPYKTLVSNNNKSIYLLYYVMYYIIYFYRFISVVPLRMVFDVRMIMRSMIENNIHHHF